MDSFVVYAYSRFICPLEFFHCFKAQSKCKIPAGKRDCCTRMLQMNLPWINIWMKHVWALHTLTPYILLIGVMRGFGWPQSTCLGPTNSPLILVIIYLNCWMLYCTPSSIIQRICTVYYRCCLKGKKSFHGQTKTVTVTFLTKLTSYNSL